jgi:hypothetical protein
MGLLVGLFVATEEEVEGILGKDVHFGEVLGKHSDIYATMDKSMFVLVSIDQSILDTFTSSIGTNPFDYLEEEDE